MTTLREILAAFPERFYRQSWYMYEGFLDVPCPMEENTPTGALPATPDRACLSVPAAMLAWAYVRDPNNRIWRGYFWTTDCDHLGQRVYVGDNGQGFEIHRHLHLTEQWRIPLYDGVTVAGMQTV